MVKEDDRPGILHEKELWGLKGEGEGIGGLGLGMATGKYPTGNVHSYPRTY